MGFEKHGVSNTVNKRIENIDGPGTSPKVTAITRP